MDAQPIIQESVEENQKVLIRKLQLEEVSLLEVVVIPLRLPAIRRDAPHFSLQRGTSQIKKRGVVALHVS